MQLEISERRIGEVVILDLVGRITIGDGSLHLHDAVGRLLDEGRNRLVLNLAGVTYVDSSGIGELVSRHTTTRNTGGRLKLLNLPKKVRDLLQITKLLAIFETFDDEASAIASFES